MKKIVFALVAMFAISAASAQTDQQKKKQSKKTEIGATKKNDVPSQTSKTKTTNDMPEFQSPSAQPNNSTDPAKRGVAPSTPTTPSSPTVPATPPPAGVPSNPSNPNSPTSPANPMAPTTSGQ